jgi:hypothetical protein
MSLSKKKNEIRRLINSFEHEAGKFHDLSFSLLYVESGNPIYDQKFKSPNHAIMLWQYYGRIDRDSGVTQFIDDLKSSSLQWGIRGAQLSAFAVLEGESCGLFIRMAKRAAGLFNEKEANFLKSRIVSELQSTEQKDNLIPTAAVNDDEMALWLNYLLYYVSKVSPGKDKRSRIEPDPFSLSLLALEDLLETEKINKIRASKNRIEEINFKVAVSFPGERRSYVSNVVDFLKDKLGNDQVFYDLDYQSQLARPNLDALLQDIYRNNSELVVVFLCKEYSEKEWCGLELRAIRDIVKSKKSDRVMLIRFDDSKIDGFFSIDGYIDANHHSESKVSEFILERVELLCGTNI